MSADITRIHPDIKQSSIPDILRNSENFDASFVIHVNKTGEWSLQTIKNTKFDVFGLIGILQCASDGLMRMVNKR